MKNCKYCQIVLVKRKGLACSVCKNGIDRYKLNRLQQIEMLEKQGGKCALCEKSISLFNGSRGAQVDHHHGTGKVRGIICSRCNATVGYIEFLGLQEKILEFIKA